MQEIEHSRLVVADFTCHGFLRKQPNPNVLTEAAHARAVGKPLVIISQDAPGLVPFDWRHVPLLRYGVSPADLTQLEKHLTARINHCLLHDAEAE